VVCVDWDVWNIHCVCARACACVCVCAHALVHLHVCLIRTRLERVSKETDLQTIMDVGV
jgi:hypothetical protein